MTRLEICEELKAAGAWLVGAEWVTDQRVMDAWLAWRAAGSPRGATVTAENSPDGREVVRVELAIRDSRMANDEPPVLE